MNGHPYDPNFWFTMTEAVQSHCDSNKQTVLNLIENERTEKRRLQSQQLEKDLKHLAYQMRHWKRKYRITPLVGKKRTAAEYEEDVDDARFPRIQERSYQVVKSGSSARKTRTSMFRGTIPVLTLLHSTPGHLSQAAKGSSFLGLPAEVRNLIYESIAEDIKTIKVRGSSPLLPSIALVCWQIRVEFMAILNEMVVPKVDLEATVVDFDFHPLLDFLASLTMPCQLPERKIFITLHICGPIAAKVTAVDEVVRCWESC